MGKDYRVIKFDDEEKYINEFLKLPKKLYSKKELMQKEEEEREILENKHVLSKYFKIYRFLVIDEKENAVARAILTFYENDLNAYIGYYECIEDLGVSNMLLNYIERFVAFKGYKSIIGPYNCSFWLGYRFKKNNFGESYLNEPYNKKYYPIFFEDAGYEVIEEYTSNSISKIGKYERNEKLSKRLKEMKQKGYEFVEPTEETFDAQFRIIGQMMLGLYKNSTGYKEIAPEDLSVLYQDFKKYVDYSMIKLAYLNGELAGFYIGIPNYSNSINTKNYIKFLKNKIITKSYVLPALGVKKGEIGLGRALAECMKCELRGSGATAITSIINKKRTKKDYFKELEEKEYNYVLYGKKIN